MVLLELVMRVRLSWWYSFARPGDEVQFQGDIVILDLVMREQLSW